MRISCMLLLALVLGVVDLEIAAADLKIDHVTIAGRDLKSLQAGLARAGIQTVYGGAHNNSVTEMALASFPDGSYLEAIALQPKADPKAIDAHEWAKFLKEPGMPAAWAIQSDRIAADAERLRSVGVAVTPPVRAGRLRPDGVKLEWETVNVGTEDRGTFFPFLIHDLTPRLQRAYPQGKPTTTEFSGVARVVIVVRNLDQAVARYRKAFDLPDAVKKVDNDLGAQTAALGASPVLLAQPLSGDSWIGKRLDRFGEGPVAFILRKPGGHTVKWVDPEKLGWRFLGIEQ